MKKGHTDTPGRKVTQGEIGHLYAKERGLE